MPMAAAAATTQKPEFQMKAGTTRPLLETKTPGSSVMACLTGGKVKMITEYQRNR